MCYSDSVSDLQVNNAGLRGWDGMVLCPVPFWSARVYYYPYIRHTHLLNMISCVHMSDSWIMQDGLWADGRWCYNAGT